MLGVAFGMFLVVFTAWAAPGTEALAGPSIGPGAVDEEQNEA